MKSRTSFFNRTVIVNLLRRYWVCFAVYLCLMGAVTVIPLINELQSMGWNAENVPYYIPLLRMMNCIGSIIVVNFISVAFAATLLFSYLYNARHTGMMASLPVKRETMYCSVSAAAVGGMALCNVAVFALCLLIELLYGQVHLGALGILLGISLLTLVAFFGMAAFCCMLTGNIFAGPAVYVIFNFLTIGAEALIYELLYKLVYGLTSSLSPVTQFLSPVLMIGNHVYFSYDPIYNSAGTWVDYTWEMQGMGVLAIYTVVGLVFLYLGMLLYKHRRMETAGDTISIELLKPIFRLCCTVGAGMIFAVFMQELLYQFSPGGSAAAVYIAVLLIIGGVLGYFISQMLITKSVNVFRRGWKSVAIYAVCAIAITAAVESDLFGFERRVPDASEVKSVYVRSYDGTTANFEEAENINTVLALHRSLIENKALHEMDYGAADAGYYQIADDEPAAKWNTRTMIIAYTMQDDSVMKRRYSIVYGPDQIRDMGSDIRVLETLMNTWEAIEERCVVEYPVTSDNVQSAWIEFVAADTYEYKHFNDMAPSEIARFYNECILPDVLEGKLGTIDFIEDRDYALSKYNCTINIELFEKEITNQYGSISYEEYRNIVVYPTLESQRTLAFLKEYGIEPAVVYDSMLDDGFDYNDLGRYLIDDGIEYAEDVRVEYDIPSGNAEAVTMPSTEHIIGGADEPTSIVVTG